MMDTPFLPIPSTLVMSLWERSSLSSSKHGLPEVRGQEIIRLTERYGI